jgi:hypothetical protein
MSGTTRFTTLQKTGSSDLTAQAANWHTDLSPHEWQFALYPVRRWFDPVSIGLWLGGLALGVGGCILDACMPYRHPVAVTISVLWWALYLGCLGASIGAGVCGLFTLRRTHTSVSLPPASSSMTPAVACCGSHWLAAGRAGRAAPTARCSRHAFLDSC